jgi:hypothetical protein
MTRTHRVGRGAARRFVVGIVASFLFAACGADQGPEVEQPIDGSWTLEGLFQSDIEGTVQCRWSGTLDLQQLPGGVNTIVGDGEYAFDCLAPGPPLAPAVVATLQNSRLTGTDLSITFGACVLGAQYDRGRPADIYDGLGFCRLNFASTAPIDVAGAWRATREVTP